jgi:hypothetical protein
VEGREETLSLRGVERRDSQSQWRVETRLSVSVEGREETQFQGRVEKRLSVSGECREETLSLSGG